MIIYCSVVTASRNMSAATNSSIEFNCSPVHVCSTDVLWSYVSSVSSSSVSLSPRHSNHTTITCVEHTRCRATNSSETGHILFIIDNVQFSDSGTYTCSAGLTNQRDQCEMSFHLTLTGKFICVNPLTPTVPYGYSCKASCARPG